MVGAADVWRLRHPAAVTVPAAAMRPSAPSPIRASLREWLAPPSPVWGAPTGMTAEVVPAAEPVPLLPSPVVTEPVVETDPEAPVDPDAVVPGVVPVVVPVVGAVVPVVDGGPVVVVVVVVV